MKNYYKLLGLNKDASKQQINVAFKKLSLQYHPDRNGGNSVYLELFKEINEAKQVLLDEEKRAEYDHNLKKHFFPRDLLLRKDDRLHQKAQGAINKQRDFTKIITGLKWASGIVGLAAVILLVLIAVDNGLRTLSQEQKDEAVFEIKELKKDSVLTNTAGIQKTTKARTAFTKELQKKDQQAITGRSKNETARVLRKETATQNVTQIKKDVVPPEVIKIRTDRKTREVAKDSRTIQTVAVQEKKATEIISKDKILFTKKQLSGNDMSDLLNSLTAKKSGVNSKTNCVKVVVCANSNVSNAFDITNFLKSKGFIISGRETIKASVEGIKIGLRGGCFVVTVGNL